MNRWQAIRAKARRVVHDTFSLDATYVGPNDGDTPVPARIRLHTQFLRFGDLDREGYTRVIDDVNEVKIDTGEITPAMHGLIEFSATKKYHVVNVLPEKDEQFWVCTVQPA